MFPDPSAASPLADLIVSATRGQAKPAGCPVFSSAAPVLAAGNTQ
jgi:hypothetical protein